MIQLRRKFIVDETGTPQEVILPLEDYVKISEILGLDLDESAIADLRQAQRDRTARSADAYVDLDSLEEDVVYVDHVGPRGDIYR